MQAKDVNVFYSGRYKMSEVVKKRGRPRQLDREAGLDIATRLFWQHGYEGTSIADLTKAMGITPPSLYATFGSKEELYRQAVEYAAEKGNRERFAALAGDSAYDGVAFYLRDAAQAFAMPGMPRGCMVSTAVLQHAAENDGAAQIVAERRDMTYQLVKARFERAIADGELPPDTDAGALARYYAVVVQGMSAQACDGADAATLRDVAEIALSAWPGKRIETAATD